MWVGEESDHRKAKAIKIYILFKVVKSQKCTAEGIPEIPTLERLVDFKLWILNVNMLR